MNKATTALTAIGLALALAIIGVQVVPAITANSKTVATETTQQTQATLPAKTPDATEPVVTELEPMPKVTKLLAETAVEEAEEADRFRSTAGAKPGDAKDEDGYITDVTEDDKAEFNAAFPALTNHAVNKIMADYESQFGYEKWPDGSYKIPFSWNSMTEQDFARQKSAVYAGLSKKEINDALDFIFKSLTEDDIQKLLKLSFGQNVDLSNQEQVKIELFKTWLENPVAFEAWLRFVQDLKVGDSKTISENCPGLRIYLEENDAARAKDENGKTGPGLMIRLRDENGNTGKDIPLDYSGEYYTNQSHIAAVVQLIAFFEPLEVGAGRYHVFRRYHLVALDYNHLRKAEEVKEDEPELDYWLYFDYYLKGSSKRAWRVGANLADREPGEIKNTSVSKKPVVRKTTRTVTTTTKKVTQQYQYIPGTTYTPSKPGDPNTPTPPPTPPPTPTPEHKEPNKDPRFQDNAEVGGGPNDDSGPGEYKDDQGNGNGEYDQGTTPTNENNTSPEYDPGPSADNTDNGSAPDTSPIESHDSDYHDDSGSSGDSGDNNSKMESEPPASDD